jgi:hypothetical protein
MHRGRPELPEGGCAEVSKVRGVVGPKHTHAGFKHVAAAAALYPRPTVGGWHLRRSFRSWPPSSLRRHSRRRGSTRRCAKANAPTYLHVKVLKGCTSQHKRKPAMHAMRQ